MSPYLLDTNTISFAASGRSPAVLRRVAGHSPSRLCVSSVSYGEIWFGLYRRPEAIRLREATNDFFAEIEILPWTPRTAHTYAQLRTDMERSGKSLTALDMLIAAHALEVGATLVSSDRAFRFVPGLQVENWLDD
ncbi:type II toxin-antitoxin system VapC family toxin [Chelativorans xinjiangense]|uniref:type II toxin-antitoxin system VapC family toxin n=1 Tax=Chelativorans xinjiangense TaxID=2681485 RepID=UPI001359274E|nr:type II toxin-antitoxin system VapC family toxin [Chelativorans xinjiangense]